jgi:hypothetical protein
MEQSVVFPNEIVPGWEAIRAFLAERGFPLQLRMIDGQLAFPDETPPHEWKELRVGVPHGMVTLRRDGQRFNFVAWGNADPHLVQEWNALVWACAALADGEVQSERGVRSADEYRREADLPATLASGPP